MESEKNIVKRKEIVCVIALFVPYIPRVPLIEITVVALPFPKPNPKKGTNSLDGESKVKKTQRKIGPANVQADAFET